MEREPDAGADGHPGVGPPEAAQLQEPLRPRRPRRFKGTSAGDGDEGGRLRQIRVGAGGQQGHPRILQQAAAEEACLLRRELHRGGSGGQRQVLGAVGRETCASR